MIPWGGLILEGGADVDERKSCSLRPYQSGETDIQGRISRCGDELARTALYEAAHTLLTRSRKWSSLRAWGMKIANHRGMARVRVAVARKLAVPLGDDGQGDLVESLEPAGKGLQSRETD
jgi:hypothetical protein